MQTFLIKTKPKNLGLIVNVKIVIMRVKQIICKEKIKKHGSVRKHAVLEIEQKRKVLILT